MKIASLTSNEYSQFYTPYIEALGDCDLLEELEIALADCIKFVREIPLGKHDYRYAPGKWTIRDIIRHIIDSERIFAYRALRFARKDKTPLPGFDENDFAANADAESATLQELLTELSAVRYSTILLFKSFNEEQLRQIGTANGNPMSVAAIGFIISGHQRHHQRVYIERYLN
ncbi:MAG TPA: DinB family protein [Flavobacterium sp.]|jgi:uncharacterized damage-inducible protein DinB